MTTVSHNALTTDDEIAALVERTAAQYEAYLALGRLTDLATIGEESDSAIEEERDMDRPVGLAVGRQA